MAGGQHSCSVAMSHAPSHSPVTHGARVIDQCLGGSTAVCITLQGSPEWLAYPYLQPPALDNARAMIALPHGNT